MEQITWFQVVVALLAASGGVAGLVAIGNFLVNLRDRHNKGKEKRIETSVELRRLAAEAAHIDDETVRKGLWQIIEEYKHRITKLEKELEESEQSHSLSRPVIIKIRQAGKKIREQVGTIMAMANGKDPDMQREAEILMERLDDLERELP